MLYRLSYSAAAIIDKFIIPPTELKLELHAYRLTIGTLNLGAGLEMGPDIWPQEGNGCRRGCRGRGRRLPT